VLEFEDQPAALGPGQSTGRLLGERANFLRDSDGRVAWLRFHGRLNRKVG
jgi:hypothetical protein